MSPRYRFDRMEIAGSLGDMGTLPPIAIGMILINGFSPQACFFPLAFFIFYPAYITALRFRSAHEGHRCICHCNGDDSFRGSGIICLDGSLSLIIGGTNAITLIGKYTPKPVVRGVQTQLEHF